MELKDALDIYLDEIGSKALLTDDEEKALAERIAQGDAKAIERTKMRVDRLEGATPQPPSGGSAGAAGEHKHADLAVQPSSRMTRETIDSHKVNFRQDIDVRGMRGDEAVNAVMHYIDDAILMGASRVRILHGTGTGVLRQLIRQYLATIPNVSSFRDEHVQFGGAGITVVEL